MVFLFCKNRAASLPKVPPFTFLVQKLQNKPTSLRGDEIKPNDRADHSQNQNFLFQNLEESQLTMISSEKDQNRKSHLPSTSRNSLKRQCPFTYQTNLQYGRKNVFAKFCSLPNVKVRLAQFCAKALTTTSNFTQHEKCGDENSIQKTTSTNILEGTQVRIANKHLREFENEAKSIT